MCRNQGTYHSEAAVKGVSDSQEENIPYRQPVPWTTRWLCLNHFNFEVKFGNTPVSGPAGQQRVFSVLGQKSARAPESGVGSASSDRAGDAAGVK